MFVAMVFLMETGLEGGTLCHAVTVDMNVSDKLSPVLMSPNNLADSGEEVADLIRFGLLVNLKSLLDEQDIKNIDYEKLKSIITENIKTEDNKNIYNRPLNPDLPWFFMNEGYEEGGDIFVKGRLMYRGEEKTFYVQFSLERDRYDVFVIKRVISEEEGKIVLLFESQGTAVKGDLSVSDVEGSDKQIKKVSDESDQSIEEYLEKLSKKNKTANRLKIVFNFFKKTTVIVSMILVMIFSSVVKNHAATGNGHTVDYRALMANYLSAVQLDEMRSLIEMSRQTKVDVRKYMALVVTESNGLSAKEKLTKEDREKMTSPVGAVGPLQIMKLSVKNANDLLRDTKESIKKNIEKRQRPGVVDSGKIKIFKDLGFENGIVWGKVDHNSAEYNENYHFRVATLLFKLNEFDLNRLKLVKNINSEGWHFRIRKANETNGFDIGEALIRIHNIDINTLKKAMEQCGPYPGKYEKCLGSENPAFYDRFEALLKVLRGPGSEKFQDVFYKAMGWERNEDRRIESYNPEMKEPSFGEKLIDMFSELNKNGDVNFILFISLFAGAITLVSRSWKNKNDILEPDEWLLAYVLNNGEGEKPYGYTDESAEEYTPKIIAYPPGYVSEKNIDVPGGVTETVAIQNEPSDLSVSEMISRLNVDSPSEVRRVGMMLTPPVEKYTIYVPSNFCSIKEFKEDTGKFVSRFNLKIIKKDNPGMIIHDVMANIDIWNIDPETVVVQLPRIEAGESVPGIEKLKAAGVRFITVDINRYKSECSDKKEKEKYREAIYSIMLMVRKISVELNDPVFMSIFKRLIERYTDMEDKDGMFENYLQAIINGNVTELIKIVLIYRPFEKLVDDLGNRWDTKALVFA